MSTLEAEHYDFAIGLGLDALQAFMLPSAGVPLPREATLGTPIVSGATVRYRVGTPIVEAAGADAGKIRLHCPLELSITIATQTTSYEDGDVVLTATPANRGAKQAVLTISDADRALSTHDVVGANEQPAAPPAGVTVDQLKRIVEAIATEVANAVAAIPLHRPVPAGTADAADELAEVAVRFAQESGDELHLLIRTGTASGTAGSGRVEPFLDAFENSGLLLRNGWLLQFLILPALRSAFPGKTFNYSEPPPTITSDSDPLWKDGNKRIKDLQVTVDAEQARLAFSGGVSDSGSGWSAKGTFSFFVSLDCDADGILHLVSTEPVVDIDVSLAWWRTLLGILGAIVLGVIGFLIGGPAAGPALAYAIGGAVIGFVLGAKVAGDALEGFLTEFASGALAGAVDTATAPFRVGLLKDFDLPVSVEGITLGDVHIEQATTMAGRLRRRATAPVFGQGRIELRGGQTLDLDMGRLDPGGQPDLVVQPGGLIGTRLVGQNGTLFARANGRFETLTRDDLAGLAYTESSVVIPPSLPFIHPRVTVGVRTSEGLLGKIEASAEGGRVELRHLTYAVSAPRHMTIEGDARVVRWDVGFRPTPVGGRRGLRTLVQKEGWYWVEHFDLAAPLRYAWSFDGTPLAQDAETEIEGGAVATAFANGQVRITTATGVNLDGRLTVKVTDAHNRAATASRYVALQGWEVGIGRPVEVLDPVTGSGQVPPPGPRPFPGRPPVLDSPHVADVIGRAAVAETDLAKELAGAIERGRSG